MLVSYKGYKLPTVDYLKLELAAIARNCEKEVTHVRLHVYDETWAVVSGDILTAKHRGLSSFISILCKNYKSDYEGLAKLLINRVKAEIDSEASNVQDFK